MKQTLFVTASTTAALLVTALACSDASGVGPKACEENVRVAVAPEATPLFFWSPACGISSLSVETVQLDPGGPVEFVWGFSVPENTPVGPWIRYGEAPSRAIMPVPAQPLVKGTMYLVRVSQTVGGDVLVASGEAVFTR